MGNLKKREIIKWLVYWILFIGAYIALSVIFGNYVFYSLLLVLAAVNFIIRLALILPLKKLKIVWLKYVIITMLNLAILASLGGLTYLIIINGTDYNNKYIESLDYSVFGEGCDYSYDSATGVYTVTAKEEGLKILQLTDIHLCASINTIKEDRKAIDACYELIKEAQPDLIIVTGDIVYPVPVQTFSVNNLTPVYQLCYFMNKVGIPWTMVYGNHDTQNIATYGKEAFEGIYNHFKSENGKMLYSKVQPDIYGRYNQYIRVENSDGTLNRILFLIDSNDYVKDSANAEEYDSVHEDQIQWYSDTIDKLSAAEGKIVRSFVYMHIPFRAFSEAFTALENGDSQAKYLFGENGEKVSCPDADTGFFDVILAKNSTDAVFVGHDHLNNMGINYKGVDLVYSKSIDYIAYPRIAQSTKQRGATLVTLSRTGYTIEQINYNK